MTDLAIVNKVVNKLWGMRSSSSSSHPRAVTIRGIEAQNICTLSKRTFLRQPSLLEINGPIKVCGDIHGQMEDLLSLFEAGGRPPTQRYIFLGDYVDRGRNSLEVICLLLGLKVLYPDSVYLIRGNHELRSMNQEYGFYSEIKRRFRRTGYRDIFNRFNQAFDCMPIAAVISGKIFCVHGGIGPELLDLDQIRNMTRPRSSFRGWAKDILWSDPAEDIDTWERQNDPVSNPRHRGAGYLYGGTAVTQFLDRNGLEFIARAHECVKQGYRWYFGRKCVTIFSAPSYCGNPGVMMRVNGKGDVVGFTRFT